MVFQSKTTFQPLARPELKPAENQNLVNEVFPKVGFRSIGTYHAMPKEYYLAQPAF